MTIASEDQVLRVHTDRDGKLWLGQYGIRAALANMTQEEFLAHAILKNAQCVRVLCDAGNARLITSLYACRARHHGRLAKIHMVQPTGPVGDPIDALHQLWCPSDGRLRYHELTPQDFASYALIAALQTDHGLSDKGLHIFRCHPAYPALSFLPGMLPVWGARVLAEIVDPRRFIHLERPQRQTRLYNYLGLRPFVFYSKRPLPAANSLHSQRAVLAWRCWRGEGGRPSAEEIETNPRHFLWRIAGRDGRSDRADLKATQDFIRFVTLVWTQGLAPAGQLIFDPEMFFKRPEEAQAYQEWVATKPDLGPA